MAKHCFWLKNVPFSLIWSFDINYQARPLATRTQYPCTLLSCRHTPKHSIGPSCLHHHWWKKKQEKKGVHHSTPLWNQIRATHVSHRRNQCTLPNVMGTNEFPSLAQHRAKPAYSFLLNGRCVNCMVRLSQTQLCQCAAIVARTFSLANKNGDGQKWVYFY